MPALREPLYAPDREPPAREELARAPEARDAAPPRAPAPAAG
jgi:hypothetical protein